MEDEDQLDVEATGEAIETAVDPLDQCAEAMNVIAGDITEMQQSTEEAALKIGGLLNEIVRLATEGNREAQEALASATGISDDSSSSVAINDLVHRQLETMSSFMEQTSEFFAKHRKLADRATEACQTIESCANNVAELTKTSQVLAINLRLEAMKLGEEGRGFNVLGENVQEFADCVGTAAEQIEQIVAPFSVALPSMNREATEIGEHMSSLTNRFSSEMDRIERKSNHLAHSMEVVREHIESANSEILDYSNRTLSHLSFQDPMSQGLKKVEHEIEQLHNLLKGEPAVFWSEQHSDEEETDVAAGEVDLF